MDSKKAINEYKKLLEDNKKYSLMGQMDIVSNEELYHYDVKVDYMEGDYYKASLVNKENDHEQIILKNKSGVYVVTPSLNKSFKFQSEWPYNSSQAYILSSLLKDLENDSNVILEEKEDKYILSSSVNYPNNSSLVSQKIVFNKEMSPEEVNVFNKDGVANITFKISKIDFKPDFKEEHFDVESNASEECCKDVSKIDEIVYPMYLPTGTKFKSEETVKSKDSLNSFSGTSCWYMPTPILLGSILTSSDKLSCKRLAKLIALLFSTGKSGNSKAPNLEAE